MKCESVSVRVAKLLGVPDIVILSPVVSALNNVVAAVSCMTNAVAELVTVLICSVPLAKSPDIPAPI